MTAVTIFPIPPRDETRLVNTLPVKILDSIFMDAVHGAREGERIEDSGPLMPHPLPFAPDSVQGPWCLAGVNRRWRAVAHHTPGLWSSVSFGRHNIKGSQHELDENRIMRVLELSQKSSLDIYLDARDLAWDFMQPEPADPPEELESTVINEHPFSRRNMNAILALLIPHFHRWRSVMVITDTYASMDEFLFCLRENFSARSSVPLRLESLVLLRANEFIVRQAEPIHTIPETAHSLFSFPEPNAPRQMFPHLKQLVVSGVGLDWRTVPRFLPSSESMETLELSYHDIGSRPTANEFTAILRAVPRLKTLSIRVSGPQDSNMPLEDAICVSLPVLEKITLAYQYSDDAITALKFLDAPSVKRLSLQYCPHIMGRDDVYDDDDLLFFCATGRDMVPDSRTASEEDSSEDDSSEEGASSPFPLLEVVELDGVNASLLTYQTFLDAQTNITHLRLTRLRTFTALKALLPHTLEGSIFTPCPILASLEIGQVHFGLDFLRVTQMGRERMEHTGCSLCVSEVTLEPLTGDPMAKGNSGEHPDVEDTLVEHPSHADDDELPWPYEGYSLETLQQLGWSEFSAVMTQAFNKIKEEPSRGRTLAPTCQGDVTVNIQQARISRGV